MGLYRIYRELHRVGTTTVGSGQDRNGHSSYIAACGTEDCGWSSSYDTYAAAMVAAQGHRCPVR
ncbi:SpdB2 protein [Streptomyces albiflavescens]|uniref:SpdB2 protein n=1 Tax=Streptomyces albiflavescens TaxID=1623582 RepID=A0A918D722_9ACTN|nr:mobile element transfer protein [Streptomyces albiflavescens]GGN77570.1 SpdB2 protein [Streptomyces albiflavescens]